MTRLVPMTQAEFDVFIEISMRDQAQGQVQAGYLPAERAAEIIQQQREKFLPADQDTPNHFFFSLVDQEQIVGGLWYTSVEQDGQRQLFVMDVQVYDAYRRRGYGTRAFGFMEEKAREMGINTVLLHVFQHNHAARAMYEKLGYVGEGEEMSKELSAKTE